MENNKIVEECLKKTVIKGKKLEIYRSEVYSASMGSCSNRALTSIQTCCGTCCL